MANSPVIANPALPPGEASVGQKPARDWKGKLWVLAMRVMGIGSVLASSMVAARALPEQDFGVLSLLLNQIALWSIAGGLGLNRLLVRLIAERMAVDDSRGTSLVIRRGELLLACSVIACFMAMSLVLIVAGGAVIGQTLTWSQSLLTGGLAGLYGWHQVQGEVLRGLKRLRWAGLLGAPPGGVGPLVGMLSLAIVFIASVMGWLTLESFLGIHFAVAAACSLCAIQAVRGEDVARTGMNATSESEATGVSWSRMMTSALPLMLLQILIFLSIQADVWIAGREFGDKSFVAVFSAAKRVSLFATLPLQFAQLTTVATIAHLFAQGELAKLQRSLQRAAFLSFAPASVITALAVFAPGWLLGVLYGPDFAEGAIYLRILAVGTWLYMAAGMCNLTLIMTGYERVAFPVTLVSAILLMVLGTLGARWYGGLGLAMASAIVLTGSNVSQWMLVRWYVGIWVHPMWPGKLASAARPTSVGDFSSSPQLLVEE